MMGGISGLFGAGRKVAEYELPPLFREPPEPRVVTRPKFQPPIRLKLDNRPLRDRSRRARQSCHRINLLRA